MKTTSSKIFSNQLRKFRKARGLKQRDAARILGFSDGSRISKWESGVCLPTPLNMFKMAALYRTLVDALYIDALREIRREIRQREEHILNQRSHAR